MSKLASPAYFFPFVSVLCSNFVGSILKKKRNPQVSA